MKTKGEALTLRKMEWGLPAFQMTGGDPQPLGGQRSITALERTRLRKT